MGQLFWPQFGALVRKNFIVVGKNPFLNIIRCFILPIAYGVFLAVAQIFLNKPNNYGIGSAIPILTLESQYDPSLAFIWADMTNGTGTPSATDIMAHITSNFTSHQLSGIVQVATAADIPKKCPQNFNFFSECYLALQFNNLSNSQINYTIRGDTGLYHIDVVRHSSDFEKRVLPLQWAVDRAIIELTTGTSLATPLQLPFTQETNEQQDTAVRLSYIRGLRTLLVLALFICYIGIAYHLPGNFAGERANLLTPHLKAMGLLDSARITSWLFTICLLYLPAWIIVAIIWHYRIFTGTNVGLVLVVHLLLGFSLAGWSLFVAAPFGKSPSLAAVTSTLIAIVLAVIGLVLANVGTGTAFIFSIIFPPSYYIFAIRAICGFENHQIATNAIAADPDHNLRLLPLLLAAAFNVFLWPWLAILWERRIYDARNLSTRSWKSCFRRTKTTRPTDPLPLDIAISIEHLNKTYPTSTLGRKRSIVTAVSDLTLTVPKFGIYVLLGSNGAGKSTTLSILGGLTGRTGGSVRFEGGLEKPERGTIGIVPQKNVLFPDLTCLQTLRVWSSIKRSKHSPLEEDLEQLLRDCDLESKIHANANTLSGGQKRKLQLAIGLVGGSPIVLVDECTSGVDPLSRRALWKTLASVRNERTIIFTTHFLDEADLLADHISILAAPGILVANGTPVSLKRDMGKGYTVQVSFSHSELAEKKPVDVATSTELLHRIQTVAPHAYATTISTHQIAYHLASKDTATVQQVLALIEVDGKEFGVLTYDVMGSSIEEIFLDVMNKDAGIELGKEISPDATLLSSSSSAAPATLDLDNGRPVSPWRQALTIFHKRCLICRRSWLAPILTVLVAVAGSTIPLVFISNRPQTCVTKFRNSTNIDLYFPTSPLTSIFGGDAQRILTSPPGIVLDKLGNSAQFLRVKPIADNATFVQAIQSNYRNLELGGVSFDATTTHALVAWEATAPGLTGPTMLNLASNVMYNTVRNSGNTGNHTEILATYSPFPPIDAGTLIALKWVAFFGAAMAVYPALFALYVSRERRSLVQSMQMSNGLANPVGLWLGHLLFDSLFSVILSTLIVIIFAAASNQFHGLGFFWVIMVLYGIAGALFAYCASLITASPLAAFATVAGYQIVMYILYLAGYLLTLTYAKTTDADDIITLIHFTLSLLSPVASVMRAAFVSVNLFSLLCDGTVPITTSSLGTITRYGGPIVYLIVYSLFLLVALVWFDSGSFLPRTLWFSQRDSQTIESSTQKDVQNEALAVSASHDILRVLGVSKTFGSNNVVDDVSLGVSRDTIFCLLGPNGAGKTTTFAIIRGDVLPEKGDVLVDGLSVIRHPKLARLSLGFCPQFTAIDSQLTVREHLMIYGRLKGLARGEEVRRNVEALMKATALITYADRLASKLSGGNQRKLSLAIALIGNPPVILIDEFSTGVDAKMKRDMWITLRHVAANKAVVMTTHSMEEASALATKVGIIAKRLLAVGTTDSLSARYATYEVHFSCRNRDDVLRAQQLMSHIPGAKLADDVATRFEVPIRSNDNGMSLAQLFEKLSEQGDFSEYTVEKATLESVFLKVIRENNVREEEDEVPKRGKKWRFW